MSTFEEEARARKAELLADVLSRTRCRPEDVPELDDTGRRAAEALAGVQRASEATWALVAEVLRRRARVAAAIAALPADPFSVLPPLDDAQQTREALGVYLPDWSKGGGS